MVITVLQECLRWSYLLPSALLLLFGLNLYVLLGVSLRHLRRMRREVNELTRTFARDFTDADLPPVTTQVPVYNEMEVVERCLRACAAMDYPGGRHTLQILDDSTDGTRAIVDRVAADLRAQGQRVEVLRRAHREGFKAGALDEGMRQSPDTFFAIFDADFVPPPDFLRRTLCVLLQKPRAGLVQARWGHLNEDENLLTRTQAMGIDGHFLVEQRARAGGGWVMNFNGTAGLWRREAIEACGGWQHDTLTEDLDLSYRSQLQGWQAFFLPDLVVPAEIPSDIHAFKSQQFRWAKGSIETALKLVPAVLRGPLSVPAKIESLLHLCHYLVHPLMLWLALMSLPALRLTFAAPDSPWMAAALAFLFLGTFAPTAMYAVSQVQVARRPWRKLIRLPLLSLLGVGIAVSNSRAVWQAVRGRKSEFVRTPKRGDTDAQRYAAPVSRIARLEVLLGLYCLFSAAVYARADHGLLAVPFLLLYGFGFTWVGCLSLWPRPVRRKPLADPLPAL
jgi:cellulose synthase/poly-beta-1,6-N-acetylglucosamine synthase-like glycosyltransferase